MNFVTNIYKKIEPLIEKSSFYLPFLLSLAVIFLWGGFNSIYVSKADSINQIHQGYLYILTFSNLFFATTFLAPITPAALSEKTNNKILSFLELNNDERRFTYSQLLAFLGEQSLCSLLITTLFATIKSISDNYGEIASAIYSWLLYVFIITIMTISVIRFVVLFRKRILGFILSFFIAMMVMNGFYNIGVILAPKNNIESTN